MMGTLQGPRNRQWNDVTKSLLLQLVAMTYGLTAVLVTMLIDRFVVDSVKTEDCKVLRQADLRVISIGCNQKASGYVCQKKGCDGCKSMGHLRQSCLKINGRCLIFLKKSFTWYQAKSGCDSRGFQMANVSVSEEYLPWVNARLHVKEFWVNIQDEKNKKVMTTCENMAKTGNPMLSTQGPYEQTAGWNKPHKGAVNSDSMIVMGACIGGVVLISIVIVLALLNRSLKRSSEAPKMCAALQDLCNRLIKRDVDYHSTTTNV